MSPSPSSGPVGAGQPPAGGEEPVPGEGSAHGGEDAVQGGGGEHRRTQPPRVPGPARHDPGDHGWVHSRPGVGGRGVGLKGSGVIRLTMSALNFSLGFVPFFDFNIDLVCY